MNELINREDALDVLGNTRAIGISAYDALASAMKGIKALPSAKMQSFEWCHDCKEYDQEAHCCHRWSKVINETVKEIRAERKGEWKYGENYIGLDGYWCSACGKFVLWDYKESIDFIHRYNFCPNCGADMRGEKE